MHLGEKIKETFTHSSEPKEKSAEPKEDLKSEKKELVAEAKEELPMNYCALPKERIARVRNVEPLGA